MHERVTTCQLCNDLRARHVPEKSHSIGGDAKFLCDQLKALPFRPIAKDPILRIRDIRSGERTKSQMDTLP